MEIIPKWPGVVKSILRGEPVGKADMVEMMEYTMSRLIDANAVEPAKLLDLDVFGGECVVCHKPYRKIEVKNKWVEFSYFEPACNCYVRCPICNRSLHHEVLLNTKYCPHCGPIRCFEKTEQTAWDEQTKTKSKKTVRCTGKLVARHKYWQCDTCQKTYTSQELHQIFHGREVLL